MNSEERIEYVKYRLDSAKKTYHAAKVLVENECWNSAINRLYYSAFYAVKALLILNKIQTKSHTSTKTQFSLNFIKTGILDKKYGILYSQLFDWRQKGDYENVFEYTGEMVFPLLEPTIEMILEIERAIDELLKK